MSDTLVVDHREWAHASPIELYGGDDLPAVIHTHKNETGQKTNVLFVPGAGSELTISPQSLDNPIGAMAMRQGKIYATQTGNPYVAVDMHGVRQDLNHPFSSAGDFQTFAEHSAAFRGDYRLIAIEQLKAIKETVGIEKGQRIRLLGTSLGTHLVSAMFQVIQSGEAGIDAEVTHIGMIEPINSDDRYTAKDLGRVLLNLTGLEARWGNIYLNENKEIGADDVIPFEKMSFANLIAHGLRKLRQSPYSYGAAFGVRRSIASRLLDPANGDAIKDVEVTIMRGINSTVSSEKEAEQLVNSINALGGHNAKLLNLVPGKGDVTPLGHATTVSFGRAAQVGQYQKAA